MKRPAELSGMWCEFCLVRLYKFNVRPHASDGHKVIFRPLRGDMAQLERLTCLDCAARIAAYPDTMDPGFNETLIEGTLIPRREQPPDGFYPDTYFCDECGVEMPLISHAVAWCQWRAGTNKEGWEHNFLTNMKIIKEVKR